MIIICIPGKPQGKGRPRFAKRGSFVKVYTDAKTASYEDRIRLFARQRMGACAPLDGPVVVTLSLTMLPPASWSKSKRQDAIDGKILPEVKPDLDNCAKIVMDACNGIVYLDDKQVVDLHISKRYGMIEEVVMRVHPYGA